MESGRFDSSQKWQLMAPDAQLWVSDPPQAFHHGFNKVTK
jgi:hypothetical protein